MSDLDPPDAQKNENPTQMTIESNGKKTMHNNDARRNRSMAYRTFTRVFVAKKINS